MQEAYIVDAVRTPQGKYGGALSPVRPDDMAALMISKLFERNPSIDKGDVEDVLFGAANQAGEDNRNVARMASLLADMPEHVAGCTVNRLCASGLQAIMDASRAIMLGEGDVYVAGGVESMSRAPFVMGKAEKAFSRGAEVHDTTIGWRFINKKLADKHYPYSMGQTGDNVAEKWGISREDQDKFAHSSQEKYQQAHDNGKWDDEIIPVEIPQRKGDPVIVDKDEHPRLSSVEKLSTLKPVFNENGTVTAGNAAGVNDGASGLLVVSGAYLKKHNLTPRAKVKGMAVAGVTPAYMGIGPVPATRKVLERTGLSKDDVDLIELNEAFAAQSVACIRDLDLDPQKINVNGGAIALGHPLGCSGARLSTTLVHEMKRQNSSRYGLATMCVGVGQGAAMIFEKM